MKYKVYYKDDKVKIFNTDVLYSLNMGKTNSEHGGESDDVYANNYIESLGYMSISFDDDDLEVSFTPCTDNELLKRVSEGKTRVRLQLLVHKVSACAKYDAKSHWHCLALEPGFYWTNSDGFKKGSSRWARTNGRGDENADTHIDLTSEQLRAGSARFIDARCHAHGRININYGSVSYDFRYLSVEMFCPALYRSRKDIYYYEREEEYRYIADNCVSAEYD